MLTIRSKVKVGGKLNPGVTLDRVADADLKLQLIEEHLRTRWCRNDIN